MSILPSLEALGTAIVLLDSDSKIAYLNHSAEQLLGYSGRQICGEQFFDLVRGDFSQSLLKQFSPEQNTAFLEEMELRTNGGTLTTNIMVSNHSSQQRDYILLELQSSEHHSHIRKDMELQQQSRVSNHLIRNLAHEIKNPLGGIKGAAQLLERKLPADFPNQYSQIIIQEADRLSALVSRLLLPAEPEEKTLVNPHRLLEQALQIVLLQQSQQIKIIKDYDPSLPDLILSPGQIQQALINLIKNATEAIESDGLITLRTRIIHQHTIGNIQHRQVIRLDVIDNGQGIPESIIKDIFYPTISGKNSSGLGLSIAQSLAQRHEGIIEVESQQGETCFSLYLPVVNHR